jgi:hypothetical protein
MTDEEKELPRKEMPDTLEERNKAIRFKCFQQSVQVSRLLKYNDSVVKAAQSLIQRIP